MNVKRFEEALSQKKGFDLPWKHCHNGSKTQYNKTKWHKYISLPADLTGKRPVVQNLIPYRL
jgi:hypothetical protein